MFAFEYEGVNWHEIVNDNIGGTPISVTFCPLCGSALAFERTVDGVITEFDVSRNTGFRRNYDHYPFVLVYLGGIPSGHGVVC